MPIYRAKNLPAITIEDPSTPSSSSPSSGPCSWSSLDVEKSKALKELIYICYYHQYDTQFPHKKLYDKVLKYLVNNTGSPDFIPKNVSGTPLFTLSGSGAATVVSPTAGVSDKLPDLLADPTIDLKNKVEAKNTTVGWVLEACAIFSFYFHTKELAEDIGYIVDHSQKINFTTKNGGNIFSIDTGKRDAASAKSVFRNTYQTLVSSISRKASDKDRKNHFNETIVYTHEYKKHFNKILDPFLFFGHGTYIEGTNYTFDLNDPFKYNEDAFIQNLFSLIRDTFKLQQSNESSDFFHFNWSEIKKTSAKEVYTDLNKILFDKSTKVGLITELNEAKKSIINTTSSCLFKTLLPHINCAPTIDLIGAGEGSGTSGLFGIANCGVVFLRYNIENSGAYISPSDKVEIDLKTLTYQNILHFFGFGKDIDYSHGIIKLFYNLNGAQSIDFIHQKWTNSTPNNPSLVNTITSTNPKYILDDQEINIAEQNKDAENAKIFYTTGTGTQQINKDEIFFLVCKACYVEKPNTEPVKIRLSANDLYKNDKFELTKLATDNLFLKGTDYQKAQKIAEFIKNGATVTIDRMEGYFVGKQIQDFDFATELPSVTPDTNYMLNTYPADGTMYVENVKDNDANEPIRYSWAEITGTATNVTITILSYVSPLRSRLDKRFTIDDFRNDPAKISTFNSDPINTGVTLPAGPPDIVDLTQNYTLAPYLKDSPPSTVGMLYNLYNIYNDTSSTMIPSYNQVLACLRNFGLLEAICFRLYDISVQNAVVKTKLTALLNDTVNTVSKDKSETARFFILGNTNPPTKDLPNAINYQKYNQYKWYYLYPRIKNPVTNTYVDDIFEYEYNNYRHDF